MKPLVRRKIEPLIYRGSRELGLATGFTDKRVHAEWRQEGLEYMVGDNGTFYYDAKKVMAFLQKRYPPEKMKESLIVHRTQRPRRNHNCSK